MLSLLPVTPPDSRELEIVSCMLEDFIESLDVMSHDEEVRTARAGLMAMLTKARVLQSGRASDQSMTLMAGLEP
jgi:hypothetical protein